MQISLRRLIFRVSFFALAAAPVCASGMEMGPYLKARVQFHYNRRITFSALQADPAAYVGQVMELRGGIAGSAESDEGSLVILSLADGASVDLLIPPKEVSWLKRYSTPSLRVLAKIGSNPDGNVVPFEVLAVAEDNAVSQEEARRAQEQAEQEAQRQRDLKEQERNNARQALEGGNRGNLPSRHVPNRPAGNLAPGAFNPADANNPYTAFLSVRARPLFPAYRNYIAAQNPKLTAAQSAQIAANLLRFADQYDVDPRLVVAMIIAESDFDPLSTSKHGAKGLGQLMPETARSLGVNDAYDTAQNLQGSIRYLRSRLDTYADHSLPGGGLTIGQIRLAMAAYNAGTGAVKKYGGVPPYRETQAYVQRIERIYRQLAGIRQ